jgi:hypothetical protein
MNNLNNKFSIYSIIDEAKDKLIKYIKDKNIDKQFMDNKLDYCTDFINKQKNIVMIALQYQHKNILKIGFGDGFSILLLLMTNPTIKIKCIDKYTNIKTDAYYKQLKNDYGDRIELIYYNVEIPKIKQRFDIVYFDILNISSSDINNILLLIEKKYLFIIDNYDNNKINELWNKYIIDYNLCEPSYNNELFETKYQSIKEYKLIDIIAFYTCFLGNDNHCANIINQPPLYLDTTINDKDVYYDSYYFTNNINTFNKLENTNWIRVFVDIPIKNNDIDNAMDSKIIKACPNLLNVLNKYKITCYFDSKININSYKTEKK